MHLQTHTTEEQSADERRSFFTHNSSGRMRGTVNPVRLFTQNVQPVSSPPSIISDAGTALHAVVELEDERPYLRPIDAQTTEHNSNQRKPPIHETGVQHVCIFFFFFLVFFHSSNTWYLYFNPFFFSKFQLQALLHATLVLSSDLACRVT